MFKLARISQQRLETCDLQIQELVREVLKYRNLCVMAGYQSRSESDYACREGLDFIRFPDNPHNTVDGGGAYCSRAIHLLPKEQRRIVSGNMPGDRYKIYLFAGFILGMASSLKIPLIWDVETKKHDFWMNYRDLSHYELVDSR